MTISARNPRALSRIGSYAVLICEAWFTLVMAQLTVHFVPFKYYARHLSGQGQQREAPKLLAHRLRRIIHIAGRLFPRPPKCLARAMTAQAMLARRGYASVLTLGVADTDSALKAHAWLAAGGVIVTGRAEMERYARVADFGTRAAPSD